MKMFRYIALLAILVGAASCVQTDIDTPVINRGGQIQVVGRVQSFSDRNVDTRAFKVGDEGNTASMCLAVFNSSGKCKGKLFNESSNPTFTLDKDNLSNGDYIYIFANIANPSSLGNGSSLADFLALTSDVQGVDMPLYYNEQEGTNTRCFPMIGVMEINDVDAIESIIQIPLEAIYAKVVVNILSKPDQKVDGIDYASFSLTKYEVHNVVKNVDFVGGTISTKGKNGGTHDTTPVSTVVYTASNITSDFAQADKQASFYFYIPERFCKAKTAADEFDYPFGKIADLDEDEARRLPQCYKPMLAGAEGTGKEDNDIKATFVRFFGEYIDHQGHNWNVSYDIYVGNDNYSNFDIERNTQYNNYVTIKGISKSNDQTDNDNTISIDHRVNIERVNPVIINLRRETLLDSHFEVRPLRIRKNTDFKGADLTNAKVRVEVVYKDEDDAANKWVGIELANSAISDAHLSSGKRKYFTTNLTTTTLAGNTQIDLPVTDEDQTVWIYVDECTDAGDDVRSAAIRVTLSLDGKNFPIEQSTDFVISQRKLFPVTYNGHTYHIEYHEEYLHNYDAEDEYGQTEYEGMEWGLEDVQLSKEHRSFTNKTSNTSWENYVNNNTLPTYDFYIAKHDGTFATIAGATMVHRHAGQHFTSEIYENSNGEVKALSMDQQPSGAVEYCYNRNKRNEDGSVPKVEWYLPSADELEDIIIAGYSRFEEFQEKYYWTSQPAYIRNVYYYEDSRNTFPFVVYDDNPKYARATKVVYRNGEFGYALSGLNEKTNVIDPSTGNILDFTGSNEINFGYFYMMYRWKSGTPDETFGQDGFGGVVNGTQYKGEEFGEKLAGNSTGTRYHIHLGHLYDMTQEGYLHRSTKARVRCVRKDYSADDGQAVLAYKVSSTPATSLDKSGNTLYVMRNTKYTGYLTTSGDNLAATNSTTISKDNLVVIKNNRVIKSVAKGQYFSGNNGSVSFSDSGTNYTVSNTNGDEFTISIRTGFIITTTYYLKQTNDTAVSMSSGNNGNNTWYFYKVEIE